MGITRRDLGRGVVGAAIGAVLNTKRVAAEEVKPELHVYWIRKTFPTTYESIAFTPEGVSYWNVFGWRPRNEVVQEGVAWWREQFPDYSVQHVFDGSVWGGV